MLLPGPAGVLEALLERPSESPQGIAVLCHPHPLYGGSLTNKVVHTLAKTLQELDLITLRFNFRGVGKSEGGYAEGLGEQDDLRAILDWVDEHYPDLPLWLGGFSFGAYVALATADARSARLISVAPPVNLFDLGSLAQPHCPWLLIQGEADDIVPAAAVREWLAATGLAPNAIFLPEAEHFFHGKLNLLRDTLLANLG